MRNRHKLILSDDAFSALREKVLKGLEKCADTHCSGCGYSGYGCCDALNRDTIDLIEAQSERIVIIEDALINALSNMAEAFSSGANAMLQFSELIKEIHQLTGGEADGC